MIIISKSDVIYNNGCHLGAFHTKGNLPPCLAECVERAAVLRLGNLLILWFWTKEFDQPGGTALIMKISHHEGYNVVSVTSVSSVTIYMRRPG